MFNLTDPNIAYLLITPQKPQNRPEENMVNCNKLNNILWAKDWTIIPMMSYQGGLYEKSFMCITPYDNDNLRTESIFLMDEFVIESAIIKYSGETNPTRILNNGGEVPLSVSVYDNNNETKKYIYNGISFSFNELKRYVFPKKKEDIKNGMIVEYFNNNKWISRQVSNIDTEWDKMYKLLTKYEKLRIESNF